MDRIGLPVHNQCIASEASSHCGVIGSDRHMGRGMKSIDMMRWSLIMKASSAASACAVRVDHGRAAAHTPERARPNRSHRRGLSARRRPAAHRPGVPLPRHEGDGAQDDAHRRPVHADRVVPAGEPPRRLRRVHQLRHGDGLACQLDQALQLPRLRPLGRGHDLRRPVPARRHQRGRPHATHVAAVVRALRRPVGVVGDPHVQPPDVRLRRYAAVRDLRRRRGRRHGRGARGLPRQGVAGAGDGRGGRERGRAPLRLRAQPVLMAGPPCRARRAVYARPRGRHL
mmetsp:Transcript_6234/g.14388  ORF Transcript_6234/g.14388 Transcript_6234/m.14388 type:complete len:284 (-) Transcript_6234:531-1382(-)